MVPGAALPGIILPAHTRSPARTNPIQTRPSTRTTSAGHCLPMPNDKRTLHPEVYFHFSFFLFNLAWLCSVLRCLAHFVVVFLPFLALFLLFSSCTLPFFSHCTLPPLLFALPLCQSETVQLVLFWTPFPLYPLSNELYLIQLQPQMMRRQAKDTR